MNLSERDIRILVGLRHGIMALDDMVAEQFESTQLEKANSSFRDLVTERASQAAKIMNEKNEALMAAIQSVSFANDVGQANIERELHHVVREYG